MSKKRPKKYEIKMLDRCQCCDKASYCEYLKLLFQKPYDASGVILDCKAFYIVFCELEERDCIPFGNMEKMKQHHEETDTGKRPYLTPAMVTNSMLAAELALKALTLKETGTFDCIHEMDKLFYALPENHKKDLSSLLKKITHQSDETLKINLEIISNFFVQWRYSFQSEVIGYSYFLPKFIHIVCDYAIDDIEKSMVKVGE